MELSKEFKKEHTKVFFDHDPTLANMFLTEDGHCFYDAFKAKKYCAGKKHFEEVLRHEVIEKKVQKPKTKNVQKPKEKKEEPKKVETKKVNK